MKISIKLTSQEKRALNSVKKAAKSVVKTASRTDLATLIRISKAFAGKARRVIADYRYLRISRGLMRSANRITRQVLKG